MKKDMPLEGLRWSRDSGSALYDTPQNGRSRTGWGVIFPYSQSRKMEVWRQNRNISICIDRGVAWFRISIAAR